MEKIWNLFVYCCEVLGRTLTIDKLLDIFKNHGPEWQQLQKTQLKEPEELALKTSGKEKDDLNWTGLLSSPSDPGQFFIIQKLCFHFFSLHPLFFFYLFSSGKT